MVESIAVRRSFSQKAEYVDERSSQSGPALAAKLEPYMRLDITKKGKLCSAQNVSVRQGQDCQRHPA